MESVSGKAFDYKLFKRVMNYIAPYKAMFYMTAFMSIALAVVSVVRPLLIQYAVNENIASKDELGLFQITIWLIAVLIVETILQYVFTYYGNLVGQNIIKDIRNEVFQHVLNFKSKYFDKTPIGRLVTRTVSDIETVAEMFSAGILVIVGDLLKIIFAVICMFYINWDLAIITLVPIPILLIGTSMFKRAIKDAFQEVRNQVSILNTFVQEHITGMSIVQIFNREKIESELFADINKKHRNAHIKSVWAYSI